MANGHSERIREIRKRENRTQEQLSELLEIDVSTLRKVECGEALLSAAAAIKLYVEFGYSLEWIYGISQIERIDQDKYLVDLRNVIRFNDEAVQITIPEKFFVALAHEDENKRIKNEIQTDEGSIPFIQGVAKQERKFLLSHKDNYYYATISVRDFKKKKR